MEDFSQLKSLFTGSYTAVARPSPIPGDLRIAWGQSLVILALASSRAQKCSLQKLHFLTHLSRSEKSRQMVLDVLNKERPPSDLMLRIEPWVNRATAFAVANRLVSGAGGKAFSLTEAGKEVAKQLRDDGLLAAEVGFLDQVGKRATEDIITNIAKMEAF